MVVSVAGGAAHDLVVGCRLLRAGPPARQRRAHPPQPRSASAAPPPSSPAGSFRGSRFLLNLREPWLFGRKLDSFRHRLLGGGGPHELRLQPQGRHPADRPLARRPHQPDPALPLPGHERLQHRGADRRDRPAVPHLRGLGAVRLRHLRHARRPPRAASAGSSSAPTSSSPSTALGGVSYLRGFFQADERAAAARRPRLRALRPRSASPATFGGRAAAPAAARALLRRRRLRPARASRSTASARRSWGPTASSTRPAATRSLLGGAELRYNFDARLPARELPRHRQRLPRDARPRPRRDLRWSAGLGLRYRTPIGPMRLDWGYVLDPQPGDEGRSHFHLSIGHAF